MAATIVTNYTDYEGLVIGIGHDFDPEFLKNHLLKLLPSDKAIVGFSYLGGRLDLWHLAQKLGKEGVITILAGPQSNVDFLGEVGWEAYPHRFAGLRESFTFALHGPAEQIIPLLKGEGPEEVSGLLFYEEDRFRVNDESGWREEFLGEVSWENLFRLTSSGLEPVRISCAQVVQQIGCPYAAKKKLVEIDYPTNLNDKPFPKKGKVPLTLQGCSFCDVARDKGFGLTLSTSTVLRQIARLPEDEEGRKIPFELVNENSVASLAPLLSAIKDSQIRISQVNLVTRADWLLKAEPRLREALQLAKFLKVRILLAAVGLESFSDQILRNLNKGYSVETNIEAVRLMRRLKEEFPENFLYATSEGAGHGFIHPTPWDSPRTLGEARAFILAYGLNQDILPPRSTPLIIHHACALGEWIRRLEEEEGLKLKRSGSIIEWW